MDPFISDNLKFSLKGKKILVGVTGSIAAFKVCDVIRFLKECEAEVKLILSENATRFVTTTTLESLCENKVHTDIWEGLGTYHIDIARWADLFLIAPASANLLGKVANGLADDLLTTELLAFVGKVLIAPAMNPTMWKNRMVQNNLKQLKKNSFEILGPIHGRTVCGEDGFGRMLEPEDIVEKIADAFRDKEKKKRVLITLGPTRSAVDPVRFFTNRSSGKMGAALAWTAHRKGFDVCVVQGSCEVKLPAGIKVHKVETATEMREIVLKEWPLSDYFISAAAVLDWDVKNSSRQKIKKNEGLSVEFEKNPDILKEVSDFAKKHQFVLGFAAETREPVNNGLKKLKEKGCHAIFVNDVSQKSKGFECDHNSGWWINEEDIFELPKVSKTELAQSIFLLIEGRNPRSSRLIMHQPIGPGLNRKNRIKKESNELKKIT